ncbi:MAG TPA: MoaD/ThiS family protein [Gaiellaceae bacterium]|nr:MoaD/ThiS family protein [Gaiellaceae bacterium]
MLRAEAGGAREVEVTGSNVREVLEDLATRMPALGSRVYGEGEIQSFVNVYVDGEDVRTRDGLDTPVRDSSTVILLPAMAGGCGRGRLDAEWCARGDGSDQAGRTGRAQGIAVPTFKPDPGEMRRV